MAQAKVLDPVIDFMYDQQCEPPVSLVVHLLADPRTLEEPQSIVGFSFDSPRTTVSMSGLPSAFADECTVQSKRKPLDVLATLHDLGPALRATHLRANKWRAWQHLLITDQYGIEAILPYTPEAIAYLKEAHAGMRDDGNSLHHLAIACHALAWDLELTGEWDRATEAWKEALFYWQRLQACSSFWQEWCPRAGA